MDQQVCLTYKYTYIGGKNLPVQMLCTVVLKRKSKWHHLWSKLPISDLVFYNMKLQPCSGSLGSTLQLTGALKRGTVWTSSSTGIGIMKGRSWTLVFY